MRCEPSKFSAPIIVFSGTVATAEEVRELSALPHLFPGAGQPSNEPRVALGISVAYRLGSTIAAAVTLNIGNGGLAIRSDQAPQSR